MKLFDWQEQILQQVDIDELGEEAYQQLLEEMSELVLWTDTLPSTHLPHHIRQQAIFSLNRTLTPREGFRNQTPDRQASNKAYLGDPYHLSLRYRLKGGNQWQSGLSVEKDAGEPWRREFPAFDSWHGFLLYQNHQSSWLRKAVLGHYRLRMGCGLVINQGFSLGKNYLLQQILQQSNTFSPNASNAESDYMQGIAVQIKAGSHITLLPYVSARQIDGTLTDWHVLTSLKTDGLHRTTNEADKRDAAWQSIFGARIGWRGEWFDVGVHLTTTHLQYDYFRSQTYYNQHTFSGHQLSHLSTDYYARALGFVVRGEFALDDQGSFATVSTLQHRLGRYWNASLLHRYYSPHYRQLHASCLKESSYMQGEQGITLGIDGSLSKFWNLVFMSDWFYFSTPQFGIRNPPSQGFESRIRLTYQQEKETLSFNYRIKRKSNYIRHAFDTNLTFSPLEGFLFRTLFKGSIYSEKRNYPSYGFVVSQAVTWEGKAENRTPFSLTAQASFFDTDNYDSRIYLTERNLLYGTGLPMLYGKGLRYSLTGNLRLNDHLVLEGKWALTNYADRSSISSGLQEIRGNNQQDIWIQLRMIL